jgi:hypothetical protein
LEPSGPPPVEVFQDLRWAWNGFWRLSGARPQGFSGPLRIPLSEIEAYCRLHSFDYSHRQDFLYYIERLDEKYMEFVKKAQDEEERKRNNNGTPPRPGSKGRPGPRR